MWVIYQAGKRPEIMVGGPPQVSNIALSKAVLQLIAPCQVSYSLNF